MSMKILPSRRLRQEVAQFKNPRTAAKAWDIEPWSLERFLLLKGGVTGTTIAKIIEATGLDYDVLFEHEREVKP